MVQYEEYSNYEPDIFDYTGSRINESSITGVPFEVYAGTSQLHPMIVIDSGEDYADAENDRIQERIYQTAYDVLMENPEIYFGSQYEMDEDDYEWVGEGMPDLQVKINLMLPPHNIREDDVEYELQEVSEALHEFKDQDVIGNPDDWRLSARTWGEVPDGGRPLFRDEIIEAYNHLADTLENGEQQEIIDAYLAVRFHLRNSLQNG